MKKFFSSNAVPTGFATHYAEVNTVQIHYFIGGEKASGNFLVVKAGLMASDVQTKLSQAAGQWLIEETPETVIHAIIDFIK